MDTTLGIIASSIAGVHTDPIGLPRAIAPLTHDTSPSTLLTSIHRTTVVRDAVSQFAELFPYQKLSKKLTLIPSTSPSVIVENAPLNFVRAGIYRFSGQGQIDNNGTNGYYWSTTAYSSTYSRYFDFLSSNLNPQDSNYKGYGFSVRCVPQNQAKSL